MPKLGRDEYYPWYKESSATLPKNRYLNVDFLKSEQRRIEEAHKWYKKYLSADRGDKLDEYVTYIIPLELSKLIKKDVDQRGYIIAGTSALRNSEQLPLLALFPEDLDLPPDYSLIRIFEPEKKIVPYRGDVYGDYAIKIDDFEILPNDYVYRDLPSDDKRVFDILNNHLGGDELMTQSVYSPMISSPPTYSETGGIGSVSLTPSTRFAATLNKQVARMLPPEYTGYNPPNRDVEGFQERHAKGRGKKVVYKTAERIPREQLRVGLTQGTRYSKVQDQVKTRATTSGEYSYLGNIVPSSKRSMDVVEDALNHFTQNEITISSYDELKEADVDLTRLQNDITDYEDFWINIVDARQVMPSIEREQIDKDRLVGKLKDDWDVFLPQMGYEDSPHQVSELRAEQTYDNVLRLAQKIARSEKREAVSDKDIKYARRNFKQQAERLLSTDIVKDATPKIKRNHTTNRESIVNTFLQSKPCTKDELISYLLDTRQFEDERSTERFIQRMIDRGYIFKSPDGKLHYA